MPTGLSGVTGGYVDTMGDLLKQDRDRAFTALEQQRLRQGQYGLHRQMQTDEEDRLAEAIAGSAFGGGLPGAVPIPSTTPAPYPGQPSVPGPGAGRSLGAQPGTPPNQFGSSPGINLPPGGSMYGGLPGWAPGERPVDSAPPAAVGGGVPTGAEGPPPAQSPPARAGGGLDLQTALGRIYQVHPDLPPRLAFRAVEKLMPILNQQAREQLVDMRERLAIMSDVTKRYGVDTRASTTREGIEAKGARQGVAEEGKDRRLGVVEEGKTTRFDKAEQAKQERFDKTYNRLVENAKTRFQQNADALQQKIARAKSVDERMALARELRTLEDEAKANHNAIMEQINSGFLTNAKDKQRLQSEAIARRDEHLRRIDAFRASIRGGKGAVEDTLPAGAMQYLKEGENTTFKNGQTWTLRGGKPVRVEQ